MAENSLLEKVLGLQEKYDALQAQLSDPEVISDMKRFVQLNKELITRRMTNEDKLIVLVEIDSDLTAASLILEVGEQSSLGYTVLGDHGEVLALYEVGDRNYSGYAPSSLKSLLTRVLATSKTTQNPFK